MNFSVSYAWVCVRKVMWSFGASLVMLLLCVPAYSQITLGTIEGLVTAEKGGVVADAKVTVIDVNRGDNRDLVTTGAGEYSAGSLTPGLYTVRVEAMGFKTMEHTGLNLGTGADMRVDFVMQIGEVSERITVSGDVSANSSSTTGGAGVDNKTVSEIPVNGRNIQNLIETRPGQTSTIGGASNTRTNMGQRTDSNNNLIDGVYDGDIDTGWGMVNGFGFQGGPDPDVIMPLDAIQEVNVQPFPKAEYGWKQAGVSNLGIKSGTNTTHGTLYAFGRDEALNARNPFAFALDPADNLLDIPAKTGYAMEQWGASLGGTLKKDKLFYFINYERQRFNVGSTVELTEPTVLSGLGTKQSIPDAIFAMAKAGDSISQLSLNLAGCGPNTPGGGLYSSTPIAGATSVATLAAAAGASGATIAPFCSTKGASSATNPLGYNNVFGNASALATIPYGAPTFGGPDSGIAKMDYHPNAHQSFSGDFFTGNATSIAWTKNSSMPWWQINSLVRIYVARGVWIWTPSSTLVNEARFGLDHAIESTVNNDCQAASGATNYAQYYGLNLGTFDFDTNQSLNCAYPLSTITGFTAQNISPGAGPYSSIPRNYVGVESLSWTHGTHVFKFGVEIHRGVFTGSGGGGNGPPLKGILTFGTNPAFTGATALEDFLGGVSTLGTVQSGTSFTSNINIPYYAGYFQDDWRATRRFTLNWGLRYEFQPAVAQPNNLLGGLSQSSSLVMQNPNAGALSGLTQETSGAPLYKNDFKELGPRLGLAYDVDGKGNTVIRVAGSIMYSAIVYSGISGVQNVPTGASFYTPCGNGTLSGTNATVCNNNATGTSTFTNGAGQNGIGVGLISQTAPLPWNDCLLTAGACNPSTAGVAAPGSVYGALVAGGLKCGDGLPIAVGSSIINPQPCSPNVVNPNLYTPYITEWTASVAHSFNKYLSTNISYIGSHGTGIRGQLDINQPTPGPKNGGATTSIYQKNAEQLRRPSVQGCPNGSIPGVVTGTVDAPCEPWLGQTLMVANSDVSNYDALLATLTMRASHGLSFNAGYTYQHCLDEFSGNENIWTIASNADNPQADYGTCAGGSPHRIVLTANYAIPGIKSPAQILEGWALNASATIINRRYAYLIDSSDDISGTGNNQDKWNIFGSARNLNTIGGLSNTSTIPCYGATGSTFVTDGCTANAVGSVGPQGICSADALLEPNGPGGSTGIAQLNSLGCYVENGTVMLPPAQGTFGDMSRNCCTQPGFRQLDMSVTKTWGFLKEQRLKAQFRAEFFNILNTVNYNSATLTLQAPQTLGQFTATPNQGQIIVTGTGSPRSVQLGLKLIF